MHCPGALKAVELPRFDAGRKAFFIVVVQQTAFYAIHSSYTILSFLQKWRLAFFVFLLPIIVFGGTFYLVDALSFR